MTATVEAWRGFPLDLLRLPHPSWRNNGWLKRNPWFEVQLTPCLRARVRQILPS